MHHDDVVQIICSRVVAEPFGHWGFCNVQDDGPIARGVVFLTQLFGDSFHSFTWPAEPIRPRPRIGCRTDHFFGKTGPLAHINASVWSDTAVVSISVDLDPKSV